METFSILLFVISTYLVALSLASVVINLFDKGPKKSLKKVCAFYGLIVFATYSLSVALHRISAGDLDFFIFSYSDYFAEYGLRGVLLSVFIAGTPLIALGVLIFALNNKNFGNHKMKIAGKIIIMFGVFIWWTIILLKPAAMRLSTAF